MFEEAGSGDTRIQDILFDAHEDMHMLLMCITIYVYML